MWRCQNPNWKPCAHGRDDPMIQSGGGERDGDDDDFFYRLYAAGAHLAHKVKVKTSKEW